MPKFEENKGFQSGPFKMKRPLSRLFGKVSKTKVGDTKAKAVYHDEFIDGKKKKEPTVRKTVIKTKGKRVVTKYNADGTVAKKKVGGKRVK